MRYIFAIAGLIFLAWAVYERHDTTDAITIGCIFIIASGLITSTEEVAKARKGK